MIALFFWQMNGLTNLQRDTYVLHKIFHIVKTMHSLFFPFSCFEMLDMSLYGREMNMCSQGDLDKMEAR